MFLRPPLDMWEGFAFMVYGPIWGILALIFTIPLEAVFLRLLFHQSITRSILVSLVMNFVSSVCGAVFIFFNGFITTHPLFCLP